MSYFSNKMTIDGLKCGARRSFLGSDQYIVTFERQFADLPQILKINWNKPALGGEKELPEGYGFELIDIKYSLNTDSYDVTVRTKQKYWGDVTGYQAQIE